MLIWIVLKNNLILLILEKITDLVRVYNEFPCKRFLLFSSGLIQSLTPNKLGVYTLANHLFNDRLVYVRETRAELLALISVMNSNNRDHINWLVRLEINSCRWNGRALNQKYHSQISKINFLYWFRSKWYERNFYCSRNSIHSWELNSNHCYTRCKLW